MNNEPHEDLVHVDKLIAGDTSAFRYFIRAYQDMAFTLAISIVKDESIAQEVAQDAFMSAFKSIRTFNRRSAFKTWFYRIVVNAAFLALKRMKRDRSVKFEEYDTEIPDDAGGEEHFQEQMELVNEAFKFMPPNEALILRLFYLEEESIKEVSAITGFTEVNVKVMLHRARKRMSNIIQQINVSK